MNEKTEHLLVLAQEQRELIAQLEIENRDLQKLVQSLNDRIEKLEQQRLVIDREMAEIPIGFDLIPEDDLKKY